MNFHFVLAALFVTSLLGMGGCATSKTSSMNEISKPGRDATFWRSSAPQQATKKNSQSRR